MSSWRWRTDCFSNSRGVATVCKSTSHHVVDTGAWSAGRRRGIVDRRYHVARHKASSTTQLADIEPIRVLVAYDLRDISLSHVTRRC